MATMDVFKGDGFSAMAMTAAIEEVDYLPSMLGDMNLFEAQPITTEVFSVESVGDTLSLVQSTPRGAPVPRVGKELRNLRNFNTVRIAQSDKINSSEIQGIRAFGQETELQQVMTVVARRQTKLQRRIEMTWENMRLGAVQGIVADADGATIYDFFSEFGVAQPDAINFDLDDATPESGEVRGYCAEVVRATMRAAKGCWTPASYVVGLCSDSFWDALIKHAEVRETFLYQEGVRLREGTAYSTLWYGDILFINYRGTDDGTSVAVPADTAKFFPANCPGAFEAAWSPSEKMEFVNTPGQDLYSWTVPDRDDDMWIEVKVASYPMFYCTRPLMLQRATLT